MVKTEGDRLFSRKRRFYCSRTSNVTLYKHTLYSYTDGQYYTELGDVLREAVARLPQPPSWGYQCGRIHGVTRTMALVAKVGMHDHNEPLWRTANEVRTDCAMQRSAREMEDGAS